MIPVLSSLTTYVPLDEVITPQTKWKAYEFVAKPGDPYRRLPIIAPYQPRIDWQI